MLLFKHALLLTISIAGALADFVGPTYPAPTNLTLNSSLVSAAWKNLTSILDTYLKKQQITAATAPLTTVGNTTFSAGLFSLHEPAARLLQYHYTAPEIANATHGTRKVDGDSIYRTASVTKVLTVLAGLISLTDEEWNRPLTEIYPELAEVAGRGEQSPINGIQWDQISPWALAAQIAGFPTSAAPFADILFQEESPAIAYGVPMLDVSSFGPCWNVSSNGVCSADEYIENIRDYPPTFLPWTNPNYSNAGFILLGMAISNITGKPIEAIYRESIFEPLGMRSSNITAPTDEAELARSVIAGDPTLGFAADGGISISAGGLLSTTNDLAKFGVGLLNSTLLPRNKTREWMKPISHTASLTYSVGAPWEIARYIHPATGKVTDIYTKSGNAGYYTAMLALIPDYDAGFSLLAANTNNTERLPAALIVLDYITNSIVPALEAQAAAEATSNYVGSYISTDPTLNSSVTIAFNESTVTGASSGLSIDSWISNGTDVLATSLFGGIKPRLLPSIPNQSEAGGRVAFQASQYPQTNSYLAPGASKLGSIGPFTGEFNTNYNWFSAGLNAYGKLGVDMFVFDVDGEGRATALTPAATRATLRRKE